MKMNFSSFSGKIFEISENKIKTLPGHAHRQPDSGDHSVLRRTVPFFFRYSPGVSPTILRKLWQNTE